MGKKRLWLPEDLSQERRDWQRLAQEHDGDTKLLVLELLVIFLMFAVAWSVL